MLKILKRDHQNFMEKVKDTQKTHQNNRLEIKDKKKALEVRIDQRRRQNK
ncbi:hypothetical protein [Listeria rustica]|uniref:Uncharacterized protein n=1 Tax=Listeria rustica TaxID=2713503 RepID=A0A7W1T6W3_9LIST|nr:hypothetical protein [Listeria rustica]MBA3926591.1 hypothetical protein [Listeria rustica]